jgi:hypothetical protein
MAKKKKTNAQILKEAEALLEKKKTNWLLLKNKQKS